MINLSRTHNCTIVFGTSEIFENRLYNTAVMVSKGAYIGKQQKIHRSDYETHFFLAGLESAVFTVDGVKIGVQIYPDLKTNTITQNQIERGAEIICVLGAGGGAQACELTIDRARRGKVHFIFCNRVGSERVYAQDAKFLGKSLIVNPRGKILVEAETGSETILSCDINLSSEALLAEEDDFIDWIPWLKKYETGILEIDNQHKKLVQCCNKFHYELLTNANGADKNWRTSLAQILRESAIYVQENFTTEENLMVTIQYPNYNYHKQQHKKFINTISKVLSDYKTASLHTAYDFSYFLKEWILSHIAHEDKQIIPFARSYYEKENSANSK